MGRTRITPGRARAPGGSGRGALLLLLPLALAVGFGQGFGPAQQAASPATSGKMSTRFPAFTNLIIVFKLLIPGRSWSTGIEFIFRYIHSYMRLLNSVFRAR